MSELEDLADDLGETFLDGFVPKRPTLEKRARLAAAQVKARRAARKARGCCPACGYAGTGGVRCASCKAQDRR